MAKRYKNNILLKFILKYKTYKSVINLKLQTIDLKTSSKNKALKML